MSDAPIEKTQALPLAQNLSNPKSEEIRLVWKEYQKIDQKAADAFSRLCEARQWKDAVYLAVHGANISEVDLARETEVSRSTVIRWLTVGSRPLEGAMPDIKEKIYQLILRKHK